MKNNMLFTVVGAVMNRGLRRAGWTSHYRGLVRDEYRAILARAKDIGPKNNLLSSYALAAWFIAMNRVKGGPEENIEVMEETLKNSRAVRLSLGSAKSYCSEKKMAFRRAWSAESHKRRYENDWEVDIIEGDGDMVFGMDYTRCGVCALCEDEGCPEWAHYPCSLDYMLAELIGLRLQRTETLAYGDRKCDFRFYRD